MGFERWRVVVSASLAVVGLACTTPPVGVRTADTREVHRYLTRSALTDSHPSDFTQNELRRHDLLKTFDEQPLVALLNLHAAARAEGFPPETLFALAELSFLDAERAHRQSGFAAAIVYAWAFLFPEDGRPALDPLNPRARIAADLYNEALTSAFKRKPKSRQLAFDRDRVEAGLIELALPFGEIDVAIAPDILERDGIEYFDLRPVTELAVSGLRNRYRYPGIGSALAARVKPIDGTKMVVPLAEDALVPLTMLVAIEDPIAGLASGRLRGRMMSISSLDVHAIQYDGRPLTTESEPTAALAASLAESKFWESELRIFLGNAIGLRKRSALNGIRPYVQGRIPVVFVHGTASSPARWADMINDLMADPRLRERFAYWTFTYDSGNPIAYSGMQLRKALKDAVGRADPEGLDPCIRDMVVLGHSQGGLLTKLTVIDTENRFWANISDQDFETIDIGEKQKALLREALFMKPLPFVTEVMFLATPHQGSYLAGPQIVRRLAERLVRLPTDLVRVGADLVTVLPQAGARVAASRIPTSIDNMSPGNAYIKVLSAIPIDPRVKAHSIISVGDGRAPLARATDGVVRYESAHIEGVDSEILVRSPHSGMQSAPQTIEEVRRILLAHSAASSCPIPGLDRDDVK